MGNSKVINLSGRKPDLNRADRRALDKVRKSEGEFARLPNESVEDWEKRFCASLSDSELKKMFVVTAKKFKDISAQIAIIRNELFKRGIKDASQ